MRTMVLRRQVVVLKWVFCGSHCIPVPRSRSLATAGQVKGVVAPHTKEKARKKRKTASWI